MRQKARQKNSLLLLLVFLTGFLAGSFYSFAVYPAFSATFRADLDPDFYGLLGRNIRAGKGLTFSSDEGPTAFRGPFYPGFIALSLSLTAGWFPGGLWLTQSLLHGLTCLMVFFVSGKLWNRRAAFVGAFVYALYPAVLWHVPRIWNEILLSFLMSCLLFLGLTFLERPTPAKAVGMGIVLATMCLTKAIFLPFLVFFPGMLLVIGSHRILKHSLLLIIVAVLLIAPWTVRNYRLSGRFIPVHTGVGGNLKRGNLIARQAKIPLKINAVLSAGTAPELDSLLRFIEDRDLYLTINVVRSGDPNLWREARRIKAEDHEIRRLLLDIAARAKRNRRILLSPSSFRYASRWRNYFDDRYEAGELNPDDPLLRKAPLCRAGRSYFSITPDGIVSPCVTTMGKISGGNVLVDGVEACWRTLQEHRCLACFSPCLVELNYLFSFNLRVLAGFARRHLGRFG